MAEKWYPVIDILTCQECGKCVSFCSHGVYDKSKAPTPLVKNPNGCIDHCHGCGTQCPTGAISYVGDDTGWIAPALKGNLHKVSDCGCNCSCNANMTKIKKATIEYLYLDLNTCDRCIGTDKVLEEVVTVISPTLKLAGYKVEYRKIEITTPDLAEKYCFLSSPTIRVNGKDICETVAETNCACCGEIS